MNHNLGYPNRYFRVLHPFPLFVLIGVTDEGNEWIGRCQTLKNVYLETEAAVDGLICNLCGGLKYVAPGSKKGATCAMALDVERFQNYDMAPYQGFPLDCLEEISKMPKIDWSESSRWRRFSFRNPGQHGTYRWSNNWRNLIYTSLLEA